VNRPHLDVRYRKGYFARRQADTTAKTRIDEVREAVWSPLDFTAVEITARADFVEQPEPNTVSVSSQIDPTAVDFRKDGDRRKAELDIVYVQKDEQGQVDGNDIGDTLSLALSESTYAKVMKEGLIVARYFLRRPGAVRLLIVVRDVASGSIGSLSIPFSQITTRDDSRQGQLTEGPFSAAARRLQRIDSYSGLPRKCLCPKALDKTSQ